jgi:hypothetical protein
MIRAVRSLVDLRLLALGLLLVACGSSGSAAPPTTPFTVWVFDEGETAAAEGAPLPRVTVALDPAAGGERVTRMTESDGHVTFDVDFARGPVHVSAFSVDHTLVTALDATPDTARARPNGFGKPAEDLAIVLPRLDATIRREAIQVHGAITGKRDLANTLALSTSAVRRLGDAETTAATYAVRAPRDQAFVVLGHEAVPLQESAGGFTVDHVKTFRIDVPARPSDYVLDLDVASLPALPVQKVRLGVSPPVGNGTPFVSGTRAAAVVESADSKLLVGAFGSLTTTPDGLGFDLVMNVAQTDITPERVSTRASVIAPDGSTSIRTELGVVPDGMRWNDFLSPMPVVDGNATLAEPISLAGFPPGADLRLEIYAAAQLVWVLRGPPGGLHADSVTMPPPLGIDFPVTVQVVAVSVAALADRVELPPHGELYRRVAISRDLTRRRK